MMKCEATGTIVEKLGVKNGVSKSGKDWEIIEYLMQTEEQYPKKFKFSMMSFDGPIHNQPSVGDKIRIFFRVEATVYKDNWYNNVTAYKIEYING